jgi:hypothetical protein
MISWTLHFFSSFIFEQLTQLLLTDKLFIYDILI